jgi:hypothetical protein
MSALVELVAFALLSLGVADRWGSGWGLIVGGTLLAFYASQMDDRVTPVAIRQARRLLSRRGQKKVSGGNSSPHPPIVIDPETEEMARRLAKQRLSRGNGKVREGAR